MVERGAAPDVRFGLPAWAYAAWRGRYFPQARATLDAYADVYDCVEGNLTFYTLPDEPTVARWRAQLAGRDFRFCFKLPRDVTHGGLARERGLLQAFFARLAPLGEHLGPFMIQLPPRLGPAGLDDLARLLALLPREHAYAVEVRHPAFFRAGDAAAELDARLAEHGCGRVLLDSRPIHGDAPPHPDIAGAVHEKPDLPVRWDGPEALRVVRFVGHPLHAYNAPYMSEWGERLGAWLQPGRSAYVMTHCPNDLHAPELSRLLHAAIRARLPALPPLAPWPMPQLGLF